MKRDRESWLEERIGALSARRMSAALTRIGHQLDQAPSDLLALDRIARRKQPFEVLVACLISLRTRDEVTDEVAPRLLERAPTPAALADLPEGLIARLIYPAGFYNTKARTLRSLARQLRDEHAGRVPETLDGLLALPGVGRKTANLVVTLGHGKPGICVDTHVHRISNRLGFVTTTEPDETEQVLRARLPRRWWTPINAILVGHGRSLCTPLSPHCSRCDARPLCLRQGVSRSR